MTCNSSQPHFTVEALEPWLARLKLRCQSTPYLIVLLHYGHIKIYGCLLPLLDGCSGKKGIRGGGQLGGLDSARQRIDVLIRSIEAYKSTPRRPWR